MNNKIFKRIDDRYGGSLNLKEHKINVFVIGLRGYTQNYGGWEAFAHGLFNYWKDLDVHFYAFEKVGSLEEEGYYEVNGVTCIRVFEGTTNSSAMMKYDKKCTQFSVFFQKKYKVNNPIMFHLGVRIGPYVWLHRREIKKAGFKMIENPAGAEWRRTKWNKLVQVYLWISAIMMCRSTDCLVCDNEGIRDLYKKMIMCKKTKMEYIAYGVDLPTQDYSGFMNGIDEFYKKWNLSTFDYYLIVGRFIPENNYEMMIKGFMKSNTKRKLLIICNYKTEIQRFYNHICKSTGFLNDKRIIMAGTLYDRKVLDYVRQNAQAYIHGHSVGGTNPGLLEAMSGTDINLLYDVSFNRYVAADNALYFRNCEELTTLINHVDTIDLQEKKQLGNKARSRMKEKFSWSFITDEYSKLFHKLIK